MTEEDRKWWGEHLTVCSNNDLTRWREGFQGTFPNEQEKNP